MNIANVLSEMSLHEIAKDWNKIKNIYKKMKAEKKTVYDIEVALSELLPRGIEDEHGHILGITDGIAKLKQALIANNIKIDETTNAILILLGVYSTHVGASLASKSQFFDNK